MAHLIHTPSGAGGTNEGRLGIGLDTTAFLPLLLSMLISCGLLTAVAMQGSKNPVLYACAASPFLLTFAFLMIFVRGKGPHYQRDLLHSLFMKERAFFRHPRRRPSHIMPAVIALHRSRTRRRV